jgi:hypothetical protein
VGPLWRLTGVRPGRIVDTTWCPTAQRWRQPREDGAEAVAEPKDRLRRAGATGPVTVVLPAKVAFNIEALFEVQRTIFDRLGHGGCYSGADIRFALEREFVVDQDLNVHAIGEFGP